MFFGKNIDFSILYYRQGGNTLYDIERYENFNYSVLSRLFILPRSIKKLRETEKNGI